MFLLTDAWTKNRFSPLVTFFLVSEQSELALLTKYMYTYKGQKSVFFFFDPSINRLDMHSTNNKKRVQWSKYVRINYIIIY